MLFISQLFKHNILKGVPYNLLLVSGAFTLLGMYFTPIDSTLRALQRFPQSTILGMISSILKLALLLVFLALAKLGVWGAMLSDWLIFPIGIILGLYFLEDVLNISFFKPSFNKKVMSKLLDYSWKVFSSNILWTTALRADVFFVNSFLSPSAVGIYMVAVNYTELLRIVPRAVSGVLFPKVSSSTSYDARALTTLMLRSFPLYIIPIAGLLFVIAPFIIPLFFGSSFFSSIGVVAWLLPGIIAWCYLSQLSAYLSGRGYPEYTLYAVAVGAIVTIVGDFLLIPRMGIKGAALVSSIAYIATFLLLLHFFHSYTKASLKEIFFPRREDMLYILQVFKEKLASIKRKELK
jgi:O-antigen/teichoic acid export membrane protein